MCVGLGYLLTRNVLNDVTGRTVLSSVKERRKVGLKNKTKTKTKTDYNERITHFTLDLYPYLYSHKLFVSFLSLFQSRWINNFFFLRVSSKEVDNDAQPCDLSEGRYPPHPQCLDSQSSVTGFLIPTRWSLRPDVHSPPVTSRNTVFHENVRPAT